MLKDIQDALSAPNFPDRELFDDFVAFDARALGSKFAVPMVFIQGEDDVVAPPDLVAAYVAYLEAPVKTLVVLKGVGHSALITAPDAFLREMILYVLPLARRADRADGTM